MTSKIINLLLFLFVSKYYRESVTGLYKSQCRLNEKQRDIKLAFDIILGGVLTKIDKVQFFFLDLLYNLNKLLKLGYTSMGFNKSNIHQVLKSVFLLR